MIVDPHPLLDAIVFRATFPAPLGELTVPPALAGALRGDPAAPLQSSDEVRGHVRDLLRHGGYKPTGRGKPASEYLVRASADGALGSINVAVDLCNVVSLHAGLPISVIDLARAEAPLRIGIADPGTTYVFNASGQTIDLGGLLCLFDASGPCANAVKDAQRTKTSAETRETLTVIWGTRALPGRSQRAMDYYADLMAQVNVSHEPVEGASS
jgi:DNA/RNA-binding domain of Phe-tRNA-synthetase-like protein